MASGVAGVLGAILLVVYLILQTVWKDRHAGVVRASESRHAMAMGLSAAAAAVLILNAVHHLLPVSNSVPGESLSLGVGAVIVAAGFAVRLLRGPRPFGGSAESP